MNKVRRITIRVSPQAEQIINDLEKYGLTQTQAIELSLLMTKVCFNDVLSENKVEKFVKAFKEHY